MADVAVTVSAPALAAYIVSVLEALDMAPKNAAICADLMVRTDLRGVDSHGIGMLPKYVEWTRAGFIHPEAEPTVARDDQATALVDGQKGLGHPASVLAMELAITKAATYGIGIVAVRNSNHFGACANYSIQARPASDARELLASRLLSPLGGSREPGSHKGYGLGVMADILSGVLSGGIYGNLLDRTNGRECKETNTGHCFAAIDIKRFRPLDDFTAAMDDILAGCRGAPPAETVGVRPSASNRWRKGYRVGCCALV